MNDFQFYLDIINALKTIKDGIQAIEKESEAHTLSKDMSTRLSILKSQVALLELRLQRHIDQAK